MNQEKEQQPESTAPEQPEAAAPAAALTADDVEHLQQTLQATEEERDGLKDQYLRAVAEMENVRRRAETDLSNAHKYAIEKFAGELLAVKDSLELALAANAESEDASAINEGVALTLKQLESVFEKFAIVMVDPRGEKFDPEQHQAMTMVETADVAPNHVVEVMQKGYLISGRVLRPAMVMVAKAPETGETPSGG